MASIPKRRIPWRLPGRSKAPFSIHGFRKGARSYEKAYPIMRHIDENAMISQLKSANSSLFGRERPIAAVRIRG